MSGATLRGQWSHCGGLGRSAEAWTLEERGAWSLSLWGGCARCAVARTPPSCGRARAASSLSNNQQAMVYRHTQLGNDNHTWPRSTMYVYDQTPYCTSCGSLSTVHNRRFPFGSLEVISVCTQACSLDLHRSPDISITSPHVLCLCRGWPA